MTELMHYAAEPVGFDRARTYEQGEPHSFKKPEGFWVSVLGEDDWPSWCRNEECFTNEIVVGHRVTLSDTARVHRITNALELDEFTVAYAVQTNYERRWPWKIHDKRRWPIDWRAVTEKYDGLIIAPYVWSQRMHTEWYYGWDCASGCIWSTDAIESVEQVTAEVAS